MNAQTELLLAAMNPLTRMEWERRQPDPPTFDRLCEMEDGRLLYTCGRCGAVVTLKSQPDHADWHEELALRNWTMAYLLEQRTTTRSTQ